MVTSNPAKTIALDDKLGSIAAGVTDTIPLFQCGAAPEFAFH